MKFWTKSIEELRADLADKKKAHAEAQQATAAARQAFRNEDTNSTANALKLAKEAEELAAERLAGAQDLLKEAEEKTDAERLAALERELAELDVTLATDPKAQKLESKETEAFELVVTTKLARLEHNTSRAALRTRRQSLLVQLGRESESQSYYDHGLAPSHVPIAERLRERASGIATDQPRAVYLNALAEIRF